MSDQRVRVDNQSLQWTLFDQSYPKERNMLVLSRRLGEEIVIGGNIHVTVLSMQGGQVRLGVIAPQSVTVDRKEVHVRRSLMMDACDRPLTDSTSLQEFHDLMNAGALPQSDCAVVLLGE